MSKTVFVKFVNSLMFVSVKLSRIKYGYRRYGWHGTVLVPIQIQGQPRIGYTISK